MQSACAVPINSFKSALNSPRNHRALLNVDPQSSFLVQVVHSSDLLVLISHPSTLHSKTTLSLEERKLSILYLENEDEKKHLLKTNYKII